MWGDVGRCAPESGTIQATSRERSCADTPTSSPRHCSVTSGCVQMDERERRTYRW